MMNLRSMSFIMGILILLLSLCSCEDLPSSREVHYVDSLNNISYKDRYINIVESSNKALKAYSVCRMYSRGKAEACNNLAFTYFMKSENIETIGELTDYYRGIFTILYSCAARQLDEVTFRRSTINVAELSNYALKYFRKKNKYGNDVTFYVEAIEGEIIGDIIYADFCLEIFETDFVCYHLYYPIFNCCSFFSSIFGRMSA